MADYLYNGEPFPDINTVWTDKETYPYAYIFSDALGSQFCAFPVPLYYKRIHGDNGLEDEAIGPAVSGNTTFLSCSVLPGKMGDKWPDLKERSYAFGGDVEDLIWCNTDVKYCDVTGTIGNRQYTPTDEVYLAASEPVPVPVPVPEPVPVTQRNPSAMLLGFQVGQAIRRMRGKKKLVAYLYNGVELPPLPEWDKEAYPYALMTIHGTGYAIITTSQRLYKRIASDGKPYVVSKEQFLAQRYYHHPNVGGWSHEATYSEYVPSLGYYHLGHNSPFWVNFDILSVEDNSVWLAASDPIPVYE